MNWEEFKKWCKTASEKELRSLVWDMDGGDFYYYDRHQHDEGFYDNWRDFDRRYIYLNKQFKKRFRRNDKNDNNL